VLSHGNLLHQITTFGAVFGAVQPQPGDRFLSVLPSWHAYERTCEYFILSQVVRKFTNIRVKRDLQIQTPDYGWRSRLWESIYEECKAVPRATD